MGIFCINQYADPRFEVLRHACRERGITGVFNISLVELDEIVICAFRAVEDNFNEILAWIAIWTDERIVISKFNEHLEPYGITSCADPKLFYCGSEVWCTFNDGTKTGNKIYVVRIYPNCSAPLECTYPQRRSIEKNWAFFKNHESWFLMYACDPLCILRQKSFTPGCSITKKVGSLDFEIFKDASQNFRFGNISIGSQLLRQSQTRHLFISHQKIGIFGFVMYFGVPCELVETNTKFSVKFSKHLLIYSFPSLIGRMQKHNKKLISCTYFSGISFSGKDVLLSYGVNDMDWGVSKLNWAKLWR